MQPTTMASKVHSGNGTTAETPETVTKSDIRATDAVDHHPTVTELTLASEKAILQNAHSRMASKEHSGNGTAAETPEIEIPDTAVVETEQMVRAEVKEVPEKEATPVADHPTVTEVAPETTIPKKKWPGDCVFRVIVPVLKVESIIGRNGDLINKMCQETKANIRVQEEGPAWHPNRIVQISGKEDLEAPLSPAMDAVIRLFKHVNGFPENKSDGVTLPSIPFCSIRLLLTSMQATSLIGNQESPIKTIQENTGCSIHILSWDKVSTLSTNSDDRVVDLQGEAFKVLQALEAVLGHLRMFLVDHTTLPLFENTHNATATQEKHKVVAWADKSVVHNDTHSQRESQFSSSGRSFSGLKLGSSTKWSTRFNRIAGPSATQVAQMMQIPLVDAVAVMSGGGTNFGCTSGAVFTVQESKSSAKKRITVEIRGTSSQVQAAQQLIQAKTGPGRASFEPVRRVVDQVAQTMKIPLADAVGIIGVGGSNFGCTNGAIFTIEDNPTSRKRITFEIRGTSSQVQAARQFIQAKTGPGRAIFEKAIPVVDQALTRPKSCCSTLTPPHVAAGPPSGEVTPHKPQPLVPPSAETSPPTAATETPVEPQTELMVCTSLVQLPPELPQVQPQVPRHLSPPPHVTATSSGTENMKEAKPNKVCWRVNIVKTFLDACIHEIAINGRENGSLKAMSWKKVGEILKERHNFSVDSKQMEHYFNGLKRKYIAWASLKNKAPNIYDPSTNTFNMTDKEWESEIKKNKCIGTLRIAPLRFPDLCAQLFDGGVDHVLTGPEPGDRCNGEASLEPQSAATLVLPSAATETPPVESQMVEVPPELPHVQPPATAFVTLETIAEVPSELPQVQLMAIETKAEVPVVVSGDEVAMQMEVEESAVRSPPGRAFSLPVRHFFGHRLVFPGPDHTATDYFRVGIDQALTGPSLDIYKDLPPPSRHCRRRPMSPPPHVTSVPSGMESIKEAKRSRVYWNVNIVKTFLDACIHEIAINGRENGSLKAMSWKKVGEILKDRHNFAVDDKQMKNYFDGLNGKYIAWLSLKNKANSMYDPCTNTFNLTDQEWETEIKKNQCLETLRNGPLPFPNLCAQLFDGAISTGFVDHALTGRKPGEVTHEPQAAVPLVPPSTETSPSSAATEAQVEPQNEPIMYNSLVEVPPELPQLQPATSFMEIETEAEIPPKLPKVQPASEIVAIETKRPMSVFEEEMLGVLKMIADKMNKPEPPPKPTFEDCEKKLNELGWPTDDPLHLIALTIFCDENYRYRELWMKLNPYLCADWVRMIGRSKRFT